MKSLLSVLLIISFTTLLSMTFAYCAQGASSVTPQVKVDNTLGIKIISPPHEKKVPMGNLTILGTSTDNENTKCTVFVDWNNLKPFQKATATGPYGRNDYSSWTFTYSPSYHDITNGTNNLTSKLECQKGNVITSKWNSINVTGMEGQYYSAPVGIATKRILGYSKILPQLKSQNDKILVNEPEIVVAKPVTPTPKPVHQMLLTNVRLMKPVVNPGDSQNIVVKALDAKSLKQISGANVQIRMTDGVRNIEHPGVTDQNGLYNYSWTIDPNSKLGAYRVASNVTVPGYTASVHEANFQVQGKLLVQVGFAKGTVNPGDSQNIVVKALDAKSLKQISGANVQIRMTDGVRNIEHPGVTDQNGLYNYSWTIDPNSKLGVYRVASNVTVPGYTASVHEANFQVQGKLLVQVGFAKGTVNPGDSQAIKVNVLDALTKEKVTGANIAGLISGTQKFNSATDANGVAAYSWNISPVSGGNTYNVTLDVSREGYAALSKAVAFKTGNPINLLGPAEGEGKKLQMQTPSAKLSEKGKCSVNTINLQSSCNENFKQPSRNEVVGLVGGPSTQIFG